MTKHIKARLYFRDAITNNIDSIVEVTANSKIRCKKLLKATPDFKYYSRHPERYTIDAIEFIR